MLRSDSPEKTAALCRETHPAALLMEVLTYQPWTLTECQALCEMVRGLSPGCKLLFLVDEQSDKVLARQVTTCKREGLIDEFVFRSISDSYFVDLLDVLCGEATP